MPLKPIIAFEKVWGSDPRRKKKLKKLKKGVDKLTNQCYNKDTKEIRVTAERRGVPKGTGKTGVRTKMAWEVQCHHQRTG